MPEVRQRQKSLGLSFAGGGVRALGQYAVFEELEKQGIKVNAVSGTSMGAFLAAGVALGLNAEELHKLTVDIDQAIHESGLFRSRAIMHIFTLPKPFALVTMEKLAEVLKPHLHGLSETMLSEVPLPLALTSVDLVSGKLIIFANKPVYFRAVFSDSEFYPEDILLSEAVLASCAYPVVLSPVSLGDYQLADGGLRLNSPALLFNRDKVEYILASGVKRENHRKPAEGPMDIAWRAISIVIQQQNEQGEENADARYSVDMDIASLFSFGQGQEVMAAGRSYVGQNPLHLEGLYEEILIPDELAPPPAQTTAKARKKGFWKRLAEAFQPES